MTLGDLRKYQKEIKIKRKNNDKSLSGSTGSCIVHGDKIIKMYYTPQSIYNIVDLSGYNSERISFPLKYLKRRKYYYGEIMPYFQIDNVLNALEYNGNIDKLIYNYQQIVEEIKKFSNLLMVDLCYLNILYDEDKGFYLIDVTEWQDDVDSLYGKSLFENNVDDLNESLFYCIWKIVFNKTDDPLWIKYIFGERVYDAFIESLQVKCDFLKFMDIFREDTLKRYNLMLNNIEDMKKSVKILKK